MSKSLWRLLWAFGNILFYAFLVIDFSNQAIDPTEPIWPVNTATLVGLMISCLLFSLGITILLLSIPFDKPNTPLNSLPTKKNRSLFIRKLTMMFQNICFEYSWENTKYLSISDFSDSSLTFMFYPLFFCYPIRIHFFLFFFFFQNVHRNALMI